MRSSVANLLSSSSKKFFKSILDFENQKHTKMFHLKRIGKLPLTSTKKIIPYVSTRYKATLIEITYNADDTSKDTVSIRS